MSMVEVAGAHEPGGGRAERKMAANRRWFDRWASRYESGPISGWLAQIQDAALAALELHTDDRLLDVGCGTGAAVRRAAVTVREAVGVDVSLGMVTQARSLARGLSNVRFVEADSGRLPFEDEHFTALLCTTSFHHYPDPAMAVREMARVLHRGGRVLIADGNADRLAVRAVDRVIRVFEPSHVRVYRLGELAAFLHGAGFGRARVRKLYDGAYVLVEAAKP
jgi:ubiquinone/menaquinone biosynthesis C-methylase UbiE